MIGKPDTSGLQAVVAQWKGRCLRCGWTLAAKTEDGCVPGNCSYRPSARGAPPGLHDRTQRATVPVADLAALLAWADKLEQYGAEAAEAIIWMSGSPSFAPEGEAHEGWKRARLLLDKLRDLRPDLPHRRVRMRLDLEADSADELARALSNCADEICAGNMLTSGASGGVGSGYSWERFDDPAMTAERYAEDLERWSEQRRARKAAEKQRAEETGA